MKKLLILILSLASLSLAVKNIQVPSVSLATVQGAQTVGCKDYNSVTFQVTGTWSGTITFEGTLNGSTWISIPGVNQNSGIDATTTTGNGVFLVSSSGLSAVRARVSTYTSGTIVINAMAVEGVSIVGSPAASASVSVSSISTNTSHIGSVKIDTIATGVNHIGSVKVDSIATGTNSIGQVTANAGTNLNTSALALDATLSRAQGSATSGQTGPIIQGAVTTSSPSYTTAQTSPLSLTTAGALRTDASATTQPVSIASLPSGAVTNAGTFAVQAAQSGTWTIQPGNTANTTAWKVDGSAVTQPVSIATLPALVAGSAVVGMVDLGYSTRSDTYTTTGNGTTVAFTTTPRKHWAIQLTGTGATPTTWDVRLEGSLDGVTFTNIVQHTQVDGQGVTKWSTTTISPCLYFRSRCAGLALGSATNIVVVILGSD